jgi:hypothetical protein
MEHVGHIVVARRAPAKGAGDMYNLYEMGEGGDDLTVQDPLGGDEDLSNQPINDDDN